MNGSSHNELGMKSKIRMLRKDLFYNKFRNTYCYFLNKKKHKIHLPLRFIIYKNVTFHLNTSIFYNKIYKFAM